MPSQAREKLFGSFKEPTLMFDIGYNGAFTGYRKDLYRLMRDHKHATVRPYVLRALGGLTSMVSQSLPPYQ